MSAGFLLARPERLRHDMPPWLEMVVDVLGFAGFIGVANYVKSPDQKQADR
jgi:hypothetical protein